MKLIEAFLRIPNALLDCEDVEINFRLFKNNLNILLNLPVQYTALELRRNYFCNIQHKNKTEKKAEVKKEKIKENKKKKKSEIKDEKGKLLSEENEEESEELEKKDEKIEKLNTKIKFISKRK